MKILVLQLARLGDIYLTWPTLSALKRENPSAHITLMVRPRFVSATEGCKSIDLVEELSVSQFIQPLIGLADGEELKVEGAIDLLGQWIERLKSQNFDRIINLTFSPLSSFLTHAIAGPQTEVVGYTRHEDGYLAIPDDASAYFYAQVGVGLDNRFHLADIFASVAKVELLPADWHPPSSLPEVLGIDARLVSPYVVVHIGASETHKTYPPERFAEVLRELLDRSPFLFVLVGSGDEHDQAAQIEKLVSSERIINQVGRTTLLETFALVGGAEGTIAGDSVVIHMASHTNTKVVNLSFATVNFYETGPRALGSRVVWAVNPQQLEPQRIVEEFLRLANLLDASSERSIVRTSHALEGFTVCGYPDTSFAFRLIKSIYMGEPRPELLNDSLRIAARRLFEATELIQYQITALSGPGSRQDAFQILDQAEGLLPTIVQMAPELRPLVAWLETEKIRLGPKPLAELSRQTLDLYWQLQDFLRPWQDASRESEVLRTCHQLFPTLEDACLACAEMLRLHNFTEAQPLFLNLIDGYSWLMDALRPETPNESTVRDLLQAYENKDFVEVADLLQYRLRPGLAEWRSSLPLAIE